MRVGQGVAHSTARLGCWVVDSCCRRYALAQRLLTLTTRVQRWIWLPCVTKPCNRLQNDVPRASPGATVKHCAKQTLRTHVSAKLTLVSLREACPCSPFGMCWLRAEHSRGMWLVLDHPVGLLVDRSVPVQSARLTCLAARFAQLCVWLRALFALNLEAVAAVSKRLHGTFACLVLAVLTLTCFTTGQRVTDADCVPFACACACAATTTRPASSCP